jgi:methylglutaconyl-CoA hydratase
VTKTIQLEIKDNVASVTLNRPDVRNAFNELMIEELTQIFKELSNDKKLRAVILKGQGESFCAGGDLNWMKSMINFSEKENIADSVKLFEMYESLLNLPIPLISLVQGHAMGGGLGLMAVSDIVISNKDAQFCFSEVKLGLAPAVISYFVAQKIRPSDLYRFFLTAEIFDVKDAYHMGLVHMSGDQIKTDEFLQKTLHKIKNNGPLAVRETKKLIKSLNKTQDSKTLTTELIARLRVSQEGQEGLKAFFEKRKPQWTSQ